MKNNSERFLKLKNQEKLEYSDIHEMVEYLIVVNVDKFPIDGFSKEDIAQEIRMKSFLLMEDWNKDKVIGNPIWFFSRSIKNHFRNLQRDRARRNPNYDKDTNKYVRNLPRLQYEIYGDRLNVNWKSIYEEAQTLLKTDKERELFKRMVEQISIKGIPTRIRERFRAIFEKLIDRQQLNYLKHPEVRANRMRRTKHEEDYDSTIDRYIKILER